MIFDVLSRQLNVFAPYFLEASAGTGKTFAIEHFVTRLIIEGSAPLSIGQILVVTFTRAATRELKKRVRANLQRTKEELLAGNPTVDYLKAISETKEAVRRIEAALVDYDQAQIYTLHGFCHRILKEFAFEAGIGFEFSDPDSNDHLPLLTQMVKAHLKEEVALPDYSPSQIKAVMKGDHRKMVSQLVNMVSGNKRVTPRENFGALHEAFSKAISALPSIDPDRLKADLELLRPCYRKMEIDPRQIDLLAKILAAKKCSALEFDELLHGDFLLAEMGPDTLKVRAKIPENLHYPGLIEKLRRGLLPSIKKAKDSSATFLRLAHDLKKKSQAILEEAQKFSPDDLLIKVEQAIRSERFVKRVREKYRAAIIDEFQDTDPIQWKIFQTLFLGHMQAVCLVGDPKQAIYAFRNADVYTYLDAAEAMGSGVRRHLDTNYRASAPLVSALNLLFSRAQGNWMSLPLRGTDLKVLPVKSGAASHPDDPEVPIHFFVAEGKKGKKFISPFIASEIATLHREKKVELHDIALLVKDRWQGKEIVDHLQSCGISACFKRSNPITESPAYFALKELLKAVCFPHDFSKVKAALGGPLIAWDTQRLKSEGALLQAKAQMQALKTVLLEKGFGVFLQTFLKLRFGEPTLLEEILSRGDLALYLDLRKLCELIIEESMVRPLKGSKILDFLTEIAIDSTSDETRLKSPSQEEKGSVIVMTMHQSKGLEFDTVFALGALSGHTPSGHMTVRKDNTPWVTIYDPEDPACIQSLEEQDAEKMRGLYVALTRAKRRLYIPLCIDNEKKNIELGSASPIELFFARLKENPADYLQHYASIQSLDMASAREILESMAPQIGYTILTEITETPSLSSTTAIDLSPPDPLPLPIYGQQIVSFTSLSKTTPILREIVKPPAGAPVSPHTLPIGSETGHLLHLLFEMIFKRGFHCPLDEQALATLVDEVLAFSPLQEFKAVILPWIIDLLKKKLLDFSLSDVRQVQQEMEFLFPVSQGMMKGFCDLTFEYQGKYYLLDWKSNYLGPNDEDYTQENLTQAMHEHNYFLQASIYTEALKRYISLFDDRPFSECFGGAIYYFIRGKAALHFKDAP